jgi:hypothetical protein
MEKQAVDGLVVLDETHFVAKGRHYLVYRDPMNEQILFKVRYPEFRQYQPEQNKYLIKRLINQYRFSKSYVREFIELIRLRFYYRERLPWFIQKLIGFADTNLGFALLVKAERGQDGQYAKSLSTLIKTRQVTDQVRADLEIFYQELAHSTLVITDLHPGNLVYAYDAQRGNHFVLIDGYGDKTLIPMLRMSSYLRKRTRLSKIKQLKQIIEKRIRIYQNAPADTRL